jgi:hypothetical protein
MSVLYANNYKEIIFNVLALNNNSIKLKNNEFAHAIYIVYILK